MGVVDLNISNLLRDDMLLYIQGDRVEHIDSGMDRFDRVVYGGDNIFHMASI